MELRRASCVRAVPCRLSDGVFCRGAYVERCSFWLDSKIRFVLRLLFFNVASEARLYLDVTERASSSEGSEVHISLFHI